VTYWIEPSVSNAPVNLDLPLPDAPPPLDLSEPPKR
jgi:hypothetical protein